jgi:muramidase (phage lysozyme)
MTLTIEALKAQFQHPNLQAFSRCVRSAESNNRDDGSAYRTIYGGEQVSDLSCHPRIAKQSPWGYTSAAGAYQAMCAVPGRVQTDTWGDFCRDMGVPVDAMPFDKPTQDAFLVWCVKRRNALQAVLDGDLEKAIDLCSFEWASFPPGRYGQPTTTIDKLRAVFLQYGGRLSNADLIQPAAPIEERPQPNQPETPMPESPSFDWSMLAKAGGAIASIFNPAIGLAITALSPLLQEKITKTIGKHTDDPKVAAEIGKSLSDAVMETTKLVTGKSDELEAVAVMRRDPVMVAKVEAAVTSKLAEIAPFLDKVSELEARERADTIIAQDAAAARAKGEAWDMTPWLVGFMGGMVLLVVGFFGAVAIMDMVKNGKVATEVWAALTGVSGTLLGILGTIYAYRFASTQQSAAKNAIIGEIARSKTP